MISLQQTLQNEKNSPLHAINSIPSLSEPGTRYCSHTEISDGWCQTKRNVLAENTGWGQRTKNLHRVHPVPAKLRGAASIPVKGSGFPHKVHLEVVSDLHGSSHAAPQLDGYLITIICRTSLSSNFEQKFEFYSPQFWRFSLAEPRPPPQQILN